MTDRTYPQLSVTSKARSRFVRIGEFPMHGTSLPKELLNLSIAGTAIR